MCFYPRSYIPIRATEDIVVYKVLLRRATDRKGFYGSPYTGFTYKEGDTEKSSTEKDFFRLIAEKSFVAGDLARGGFHSFCRRADASSLRGSMDFNYSFNPTFLGIIPLVVNMIIPKDSLYLTNEIEYFSNVLYFPPLKEE